MPDTRYVANIKIERVTIKPNMDRGSASGDKRVIEGTTVVVRSNTFEGLKDKVAKHFALIDDEDFGDERTHRG